MDSDTEIAFRQFRPFCLVLLSAPSKEALGGLQTACHNTDSQTLQALQEYLMFPQQLYLKKPSLPGNYTLEVVAFIQRFYSRCQLEKVFILQDCINACLSLVSDPNGEKKMVGEDLKLGVVSCIETMLRASTVSVLEDFYVESFKLPLSHLIFLTLSWTEDNSSPGLRTGCVRLIQTLGRPPIEVLGGFRSVFTPLVPGILSRLVKLSTSSRIIQSGVKALAIDTWAAYVSLLVTDQLLPAPPAQLQETSEVDAVSRDLQTTGPTKHWLEQAQSQILSHLEILQGLASHSDSRVRRSVTLMAETVVNSSWEILRNSSHILLNIIVVSAMDELADIAAVSVRLAAVFVHKSSERLDELGLEVNQRLFKLSEALGQSLGLYEAKKVEETLLLIKGYLTFLQRIEATSTFFLSRVHVRRLVQSLIRLSQFCDQNTFLFGGLEDFSTLEFLFSPDYYLSHKRPPKMFRHLTNQRLVDLVCDICHVLGSMESFYCIAEYLLEGVEELDHFKREALFILNETLLGAGDLDHNSDLTESSSVADTCLNIMDQYLGGLSSSGLHNHQALQTLSGGDRVGVAEEWTSSLLTVEGLGIIGRIMGGRIGSYIPAILVHIITNTNISERLGAHVLYFALYDLAKGSDVTILELITRNVDHLAKDLNLLLRRGNNHSPGLPTLIRMVLRVSPREVDQQDLYDTVESLVQTLAISDERSILEILQIVRIFVFGFRERVMTQDTEVSGEVTENKVDAKGLITRMIIDLEEKRRTDEGIIEAAGEARCPEDGFHSEAEHQDDEEDPIEDAVAEDTKKPLTLDQKFLKIVIEHVRHFIPMAGKPTWQLAALDSVSCCIDLLAHTPGQLPGSTQETILPLVHQTWLTLKLLFKSNNLFVVDKAFDCLVILARHARDFIHKRVVTEVFPPLLNFFTLLEVMVKDRDKQNTLAATQSRRILGKLVSGIWEFLELLQLQPLEADPLIQLLVQHMKDKLSSESELHNFFQPKRRIDANILKIKLSKS